MIGERPRGASSGRLFYAGGGPGDFVRAHRKWRKGVPDSREISKTFSGQVADYCKASDIDAYFVSPHPDSARVEDGRFVIEHRPKPTSDVGAIRHQLRELWYGVGLAASARRFQANVALVDSGATSFPAMLFFKLVGIRVVCILHNTLWPKGHPPTRPADRLQLWASGLFFRFGADAVIGVSPECTRQVEELTKGRPPPLFEARAQFWRTTFADDADPPVSDSPFVVLYVGRIEENKGVFDLVEMAAHQEHRSPGRFRFEIWGDGEALQELRELIERRGLATMVRAPGYLSPDRASEVRAQSHVGIVPTRSNFNEGMAMTAIESILARRPLIASSAVPAVEVLREASVECPTDDVDSFVDALESLASEEERYSQMVSACDTLRDDFFDNHHGLEHAIRRAVESLHETE